MKYNFADFNIEVSSRWDYILNRAKDYETDFNIPHLKIAITDADLLKEASLSPQQFSSSYYEFIAVMRKLAEWLPQNDAFLLHSATFDVDGVGVAFAAHSGTGKTTHMRLWKEYLGDRMTVINGDKPMIRFFDSSPYPTAYGTPWNGKENFGCNGKTELRHICFIERSEKNYAEKAEKQEIINKIFNQVFIPRHNPQIAMKALELIDRLLSVCELWTIHCNMDSDAGEIIYKQIFK